FILSSENWRRLYPTIYSKRSAAGGSVRDVMAVTEPSTRFSHRTAQRAERFAMKKSPTRESPLQPSEQPQPRHRKPHHRNAYDCQDEYELPFAQHWTASEAGHDDD